MLKDLCVDRKINISILFISLLPVCSSLIHFQFHWSAVISCVHYLVVCVDRWHSNPVMWAAQWSQSRRAVKGGHCRTEGHQRNLANTAAPDDTQHSLLATPLSHAANKEGNRQKQHGNSAESNTIWQQIHNKETILVVLQTGSWHFKLLDW